MDSENFESVPPGIGWIMYPVLNQSAWRQHLWISIWLIPAIWGMYQLGQAFVPEHAECAIWLTVTSPVVVLCAQSLSGDLPMLACAAVGFGAIANDCRNPWFWAFIAGCTLCFGDSGIMVIAALFALAWSRNGLTGMRSCLAALLPLGLMGTHELLSHGHWNWFDLTDFQHFYYEMNSGTPFHNLVAALAMLSGAVVSPLIAWNGNRSFFLAAIGGSIGWEASSMSHQSFDQMVPTILFSAIGAVAAFPAIERTSRQFALSVWAGLGFFWFAASDMAMVPMWMPFLPPLIILGLRHRPTSFQVAIAVSINVLLSLGIAIDDYEFAQQEHRAATWVGRLGPTGRFSGRGVWQHDLESAGWKSVESDGLPDAGIFATSADGNPLSKKLNPNWRIWKRITLNDRWPGPRLRSSVLRAAYYGGGRGAYAPWVLSNEPYDQITIYLDENTPNPLAPLPP